MEIEDAEHKEELRRNQGKAYKAAVDYLKLEHVDWAETKPADDYLVTLACEEAEGMYVRGDDGLEWRIPDDSENQHMEIIVQDKDDGRFLPGLDITAVVTRQDGATVFEGPVPFVWHPYTFHYGTNFTIPEEGEYDVLIAIDAPVFARHDEALGDRYESDVEVTFKSVEMEPQWELHGPE